jgi:hypothetical protein
MCIIYFASYQGCDHLSFLGSFNCSLNCPTGTRHTFHIEDSGGACQTCIFLRKEELDPDIVPVKWNASTHEPNVRKFRHVHSNIAQDVPKHQSMEESHTEEITALGYEPTTASLSDPDSLTSEWRQDLTSPLPVRKEPPAPADQAQPPEMTPRTAAHRSLVQDQLKKLTFHAQAQHRPNQPPMGHFYVPGGHTAGHGGYGHVVGGVSTALPDNTAQSGNPQQGAEHTGAHERPPHNVRKPWHGPRWSEAM